MIPATALFESFKAAGLEAFLGVPDSVLKGLSAHFATLDPESHIVTANEGAAVALASGIYLSSGKLSLVYMQNSGLGNAVNPLLSLAGKDVYSIPMVLLVGWRGGPDRPDEPQHRQQGRVTPSLLDTLDIEYQVLEASQFEQQVHSAVQRCQELSSPVALLVPYGSLSVDGTESVAPNLTSQPTRLTVLKCLTEHFQQALFVATTGRTGRELYQIRQDAPGSGELDFLNVGAMGHASQIALGMALQHKDKQIVCLDGDGSVLMHSGNLATIGHLAPANFKHVVLNNGSHESVGGQAVCGQQTDYQALAQAFAYKSWATADSERGLEQAVMELQESTGPSLLEVKIQSGTLPKLGRPKESPKERKQKLMEMLNCRP